MSNDTFKVSKSDGSATVIDVQDLNEAMWAACNVRHTETEAPTMEAASEMAIRAVMNYLHIEHTEYENITSELRLAAIRLGLYDADDCQDIDLGDSDLS